MRKKGQRSYEPSDVEAIKSELTVRTTILIAKNKKRQGKQEEKKIREKEQFRKLETDNLSSSKDYCEQHQISKKAGTLSTASSSSTFQAMPLRFFNCFGEIFAYVTGFFSPIQP